jgi:hypothetical protein
MLPTQDYVKITHLPSGNAARVTCIGSSNMTCTRSRSKARELCFKILVAKLLYPESIKLVRTYDFINEPVKTQQILDGKIS